jgi:hypothetical protein
MKFKFAIEETHVKILEVDTGTAAIPQIPKTMEDIMNIGRDAYDKLIESGKELPSDNIDSQIFPQCCECGETLNPDDNPARFYDGLMVCESCKRHLQEIDERNNYLDMAGIDPEAAAFHLVGLAKGYNKRPHTDDRVFEIESILNALRVMGFVAYGTRKYCGSSNDFIYASIFFNGKEYPI